MEKTAQAQKRLHLYMLAMAIVVFAAYFPATILAAKWLERDTRSQIITLQATDKKQTELAARQSRVQTVRQELAEQLPPFRMTSLINTTARHLPPDAWANRLEYANGKVSLAGQAADPSSIVRQLKKAKLLSNAKLDAVASAANPGEPPQFEISAVIAGGRN
jgi:Tfp pilus assembly protein PilN